MQSRIRRISAGLGVFCVGAFLLWGCAPVVPVAAGAAVGGAAAAPGVTGAAVAVPVAIATGTATATIAGLNGIGAAIFNPIVSLFTAGAPVLDAAAKLACNLQGAANAMPPSQTSKDLSIAAGLGCVWPSNAAAPVVVEVAPEPLPPPAPVAPIIIAPVPAPPPIVVAPPPGPPIVITPSPAPPPKPSPPPTTAQPPMPPAPVVIPPAVPPASH